VVARQLSQDRRALVAEAQVRSVVQVQQTAAMAEPVFHQALQEQRSREAVAVAVAKILLRQEQAGPVVVVRVLVQVLSVRRER
jgi:hypothetical protein